MQTNPTLLAQFTTNSFVGNPIGVIILGTAAGMGFMFVGIMLGSPIVLSMILLFAGIGLVYGYMIGKVQYSLYADGIEQRIKKFIPYYLKKKEETRFIKWEQIKSFKNDTDFSRQVKEYEYIKLYLNTPPREIWITDQIDPVGFNVFNSAFLLKMQEFTPQPQAENEATISYSSFKNVQPSSSIKPIIKQKKSFYNTVFAKVITLLFVAVSLSIAWFGIINGMRLTNWFRLGIILIPGTIYMVYRVFVRSNK